MPVPVQESLPLAPGVPGERLQTLADRCCALIARRGRPLEVGEIVAQVIRIQGAPLRLQRRLVAEIVDPDRRLGWRGRDLVGLDTPAWSAATLAEASFCVVDLETTGGRPGHAKIIEIGAARVQGLAIVERFTQLVDPTADIPPVITHLTGISASMLAGQPRIAEALASFIDFCGQDVVVAHNAPFDLRFLNYERHRMGQGHFDQPVLDTLALARRLLRGRVDRFDLNSLSTWLVTAVRPCHRALADAEATAELLLALIAILDERGERTVAGALRLSRPKANRFAHKLALAEGLPSGPGIYLMRDRSGGLLYVGKAANLRRRVRSYFGPSGRHSRQIGRVLERLGAIEHEVCGSEFEASLKECRLLAEQRPPGNRRGVAQDARRYLKLTVAEEFPRCYVVTSPLDDSARYFGPLLSARSAKLAAEAVTRIFDLRSCHPICRPGAPTCDGCLARDTSGHLDRYRAAVQSASLALAGDDRGLAVLAEAISQGVADGRVRPLDGDRERVDALLSAIARLAKLRRAAGLNAVVIEPGSDGRPIGFFIQSGIVVYQADARDRAAVQRGLDRLRAESGPLPAGAVEEVTIVREHVARRDGEPTLLQLPIGWSDSEVVDWVRVAATAFDGLLEAA